MKRHIVEDFTLDKNLVTGEKRAKLVEAVNETPMIPQKAKELLQQESIAIIKVIQSGWSKNRNYYTTERLSELPDIIMKEARVQYINHSEESKYSRDILELASYSEYVWYDSVTESVYAAVYFPQSKSDTSWLFEIAERSPEVVGASIASYVEVEEDYTKEGITGYLITAWEDFQSFDYVLFPSAGGKAVTTEAKEKVISEAREAHENKKVAYTKESITLEARLLLSHVRGLESKHNEKEKTKEGVKDTVAKNIHKAYFWQVIDAITDVFYEVLYYGTVEPKDRDTTIKQAFDEAYAILSELSFVQDKQSKEGEMPITLKQLELEAPELLASIKVSALADAGEKDLKKSVESLKSEVAELGGKVTASESAIATLESEKAEMQTKLDGYAAIEAKEARQAEVKKLLEKYNIPEAVVTEGFKTTLMSISQEGLEAEVKDRADSLAKYKAHESTPNTQTKESENYNDMEDKDSVNEGVNIGSVTAADLM